MLRFFTRLAALTRLDIDHRIPVEMDQRSMDRFRVHTKALPSFRFVDLYRATQDYCEDRFDVRPIDTQHEEDLNSILHGERTQWFSRKIHSSTTTAWPVGPEEEIYLPVDRFWLCVPKGQGGGGGLVARLRYIEQTDNAILEVASDGVPPGDECVKAILDSSLERSIYRNRVLELAFEAGTKDEYDDVEKPERLRILFKAYEPVDESDVVIDEEVRRILWRNVVDLHLRRGILKANRVPVRRGVLLYGPPGTGKTFACRYLCTKLTETTRIIVAGTALLNVGAIFNLARMLQPSLVILEDVDLVFASRDINFQSSKLGDLLDQMDGLRPYEDIGIVLTTNSIERMEAAIKDRPGRISQCIFFGPPNPDLRRRYIGHYLRSYDASALDLDQLVAESDGATQAFLKEWVHRSVQMACERLDDEATRVDLRNEDFRRALIEMKRFSEGSTGRIIGFHGSH